MRPRPTLVQTLSLLSASWLVRNLALTPAAFGQAVTFMVNVTVPVRVPTGTVQFTLNGVNFGAPVVRMQRHRQLCGGDDDGEPSKCHSHV